MVIQNIVLANEELKGVHCAYAMIFPSEVLYALIIKWCKQTNGKKKLR